MYLDTLAIYEGHKEPFMFRVFIQRILQWTSTNNILKIILKYFNWNLFSRRVKEFRFWYPLSLRIFFTQNCDARNENKVSNLHLWQRFSPSRLLDIKLFRSKLPRVYFLDLIQECHSHRTRLGSYGYEIFKRRLEVRLDYSYIHERNYSTIHQQPSSESRMLI